MKIFLSVAFCVFSILVQAQTNNRFDDEGTTTNSYANPGDNGSSVPLRERFGRIEYYRFGGNLSAGFGNYTYVNVSPRVYFLPTDKLWTGAGFNFIYTNVKDYPAPYNESFTYGPSVLAMYELFSLGESALFAQAEYEALSFEVVDQTGFNEFAESRIWANNLLLGGALNVGTGGVAVFVSVLYNVTYQNSLVNYYGSPWVFRIGIGI